MSCFDFKNFIKDIYRDGKADRPDVYAVEK